MKLSDLQFDYPEELIAQTPQRPSRVLCVENNQFKEISIQNLIDLIPTGDVLVVNETKVVKRRVYTAEGLEILFLSCLENSSESGEVSNPQAESAVEKWQVLFPSKKFKVGETLALPDFQGRKVNMTLLEKGRPQTVSVSEKLTESYFQANAELPLPPYIQKARGERHTVAQDENWYQTAWAKAPGSLAAPTASLHFSDQDIQKLKTKGVQVLALTLHVGLGTFLPVTADDLDQHDMHEEWVEISAPTWLSIEKALASGKHIWSLGTTSTRALESAAAGLLKESQGGFQGFTKLLIQPGYQWKVVSRLLTNFHQPESTLLALVAAFSELNTVKSAYRYAIDQRFRLFSYGDLSVWIK